jgi:hypothetical protein
MNNPEPTLQTDMYNLPLYFTNIYCTDISNTIIDHKDMYMVLCTVLYNVPFLRNVKSYFWLHVKQALKTGPVRTKIQFAEHNSVQKCTQNLGDKTQTAPTFILYIDFMHFLQTYAE